MSGEAAAPVVNAVNPASGTIGAEVTIAGSGFAGVAGVSFDAAASEFSVRSSAEITATVPAGASTGPVAVTGPGGTASSPGLFTVTPGIALSAVSGPPGTTVTVAGAGFGAYEAVDIYVGTAEQALASASGTGNFAGIPVQIPASAPGSGTAYLTAVGRHSGLSAQAQFSVLDIVTVTNPGTIYTAIGQACSLPIQASDSASGQTLTYTATGLPPGLSINPSTGLISGTPTMAGSSTVTVTVQDTTGVSGSVTFIITVVSVMVTNPGTQVSVVGTAVSLQIQASTSPPGRALYYVASVLPPGLSMSVSGLISGTPTTSGSLTVTVRALDTSGASGTAGFEWEVSGPIMLAGLPGACGLGSLEDAVDGRTTDGEHFGEVRDGVFAGGGHRRQLATLPGRQLGLLAAQFALGASDGHAFGTHPQEAGLELSVGGHLAIGSVRSWTCPPSNSLMPRRPGRRRSRRRQARTG